jgi:hypothetical protein
MNTEVTRDSIKHFVDAIGDLNPLFRDREYAKKTKYGCLIAPPTILYTMGYGSYPDPPEYPPPQEFTMLYAGDEYEWYSPISEGDEIDWKTTFPTDIQVKQTKAIGPVAFLYGRHEFFRHKGGVPLATCNFWDLTFKGDLYGGFAEKPFEKPKYTEDFIKEVYAAQDSELVRGAEPRYWEDVEVGEELTPVVRGPLTVTDTVAWIKGGCGEPYFCSNRLYRFIYDHSGWGTYDPDLKVYKNFHEDMFSRGGGRFGSQRTSWIDMVLTNWVGDEGFVWKLRSEHRRRGGGFGDVFYCKAKVTKKYAEEGKYCVDIECWIEDQRGVVILPARATVLLPSREHGPVIYPSPRPAV